MSILSEPWYSGYGELWKTGILPVTKRTFIFPKDAKLFKRKQDLILAAFTETGAWYRTDLDAEPFVYWIASLAINRGEHWIELLAGATTREEADKKFDLWAKALYEVNNT